MRYNIFYMKSDKKGFTLIELLVILAIISLLSTIIFAYLNSARKKAADTSIKANLSTIRTQAEVVYDRDSSYSLLFDPGTPGLAAYTAAAKASDHYDYGYKEATDEHWMVVVYLNRDPLYGWCVDSTNSPRKIPLPENPSYPCPNGS